MNVLETFRVAWRALLRNKMRSFLTTLGIVIGVAAVIAMVTVGDGAKARVEESFAAMGSNMLILLPGTSTHGGMGGGFGSLPTVTWDDVRAVQTELPAVKYVSPNLRAAAPVVAEDQNWSTSIFGVGVDYFQIRNWGAATGSLFSQSDLDAGSKVVLIGQTVATQLYGAGIDPVGRTVRIKGVPFLVVGTPGRSLTRWSARPETTRLRLISLNGSSPSSQTTAGRGQRAASAGTLSA